MKRISIPETQITYPSIDEFISFMSDKEIVVITNYVEDRGDMEIVKNRHFLNDNLLMREGFLSQFVLYDEFFDVRIYMTRVAEDNEYIDLGFHLDDVKDFDVRQKITAILDKNSKEYYSADSDQSFEYESWSKTVRASYFVTRFHSDPLWEADPVCLLNFRLSVFVLPGTISPCKSKRFSANKLACETINGDQYVIDSIHFNTDICFNLQEFEKLIDAYFYEISLA